jgi:hypothetical protein
MAFVLYLGVLIITFVRPAELFPALEGLEIVALVSVAALGSAMLTVVSGRGPTLRAPQLYLVILLTLWVAFSVIASQFWLGAALYVFVMLWSSPALVFLLTTLNLVTLRRLKIAAGLVALLIVFTGAQGVYAYHSDAGLFSRFLYYEGINLEEAALRMTAEQLEEAVAHFVGTGDVVIRIRGLGFLNDPNDLAQALVAALPLLLCLRRPGRFSFNLVAVWVPVGVALYAISLTRSRGGLLALVAVMFLLGRKRLGRTLSMILSAGGLAGLLLMGFIGGRQFSLDESSMGRAEAWYEGLNMLRSSPIWGTGYGSFADLNYLVAHNSFVHCFAEVGLVGYFIWLMLIVLTLSHLATVARGSPDTEGEGGDPTEETGAGDESEETVEDEEAESEEEELSRWAEASWISLAGFLVGSLFLSRTYGTMLFLLLGLGVAVVDMARAADWEVERREPILRILQVGTIEVASIIFVWLAVKVLL